MQEAKHQTMQIPGVPLMVKGLKADYHVRKHQLKLQKCPFDAGFDLYPDRAEPIVTPMANDLLIVVGTSLHVHYVPGTYGMIVERSSSMAKLSGARVKTAVIDCGYTGEILIGIVCHVDSADAVLNRLGQLQREEIAVAQMISMTCLMPMFAQWNDQQVLGGRGANGFGHSDIFLKGA